MTGAILVRFDIRLWLVVAASMLVVVVCCGQGVINTAAGTGTCCGDADGVAATSPYLQSPDGLTIDSAGDLYIWETKPFRVRKVDTSGKISTVAGMYQNFTRIRSHQIPSL